MRKLYRYLKQRGVQPWLDEIDLLPGQDWRAEIPNALYSSDVIIVCLSKSSVDKEGYVQKEISFALDKALEKPQGTIFIIPAKLEECNVPSRLSHYQWVDLFYEGGYKRLMNSLNVRAARLGPSIAQAPVTDEPQVKEPETTNQSSVSSPDLSASFPSNSLKLALPQAMPILRMVGIVVIILLLVWIGSWVIPEILSPVPTAGASTSSLSSAPASQPASATGTNPVLISSTPPEFSPTPYLLRGSTVQHQVADGESLIQIARCYGANFDEVRNANSEIENPNDSLPDMIVNVPHIGSNGKIYGPPCSVLYTVQSKDTWSSIAQKYHADIVILQALNPGELSVGRRLNVPRIQEAQSLTIPQGSTTVINDGTLAPDKVLPLPLRVEKGQTISVNLINLTAPDSATLAVLDPAGSTIKPLDNVLVWSGLAPETGDYRILIMGNSTGFDYRLEVSLTNIPLIASATSTP